METLDHPSFIHHPSRLITYGVWGVPSHPSITRNVMLDAEWTGALSRGEVVNLNRYDLNKFDADDLEDRKHRAIAQDYDLRFGDAGNRLTDWGQIAGEEEATARAAARKAYTDERAAIVAQQAELEKSGKTLTDDQAKRLKTLDSLIDNIDRYGSLTAAPNGFGDGTSTLYDRLSAANVPRHRYSLKKVVKKDGPFSVRTYLWKPPDDQANYYYRIEWSWWRFEITQDRKAKLYRLNDKLTAVQFKAKEEELNATLDNGRMTAADMRAEKDEKRKIKGLRHTMKDADDATKKDLEKQIKTLEDGIDKRRKDKRHLTAEQEKLAAALKKELYLDVKELNFGQNAENFFGQDLMFTFLPQRRGFVTIVLEGCDPVSVEDKTITKKKQYGTVWNDSRLAIKHNGGSIKWQIGEPIPASYCVMHLERQRLGFKLPEGEGFIVLGGDADAGPETTITFQCKEVEGSEKTIGGVYYPPEYDFYIEWSGPSFAWLYSAQYYLAAGARNGSGWTAGERTFDSATRNRDGVSPIQEVQLEFDESRNSMSARITLRNTLLSGESDDTELGALPNFDGLLGELYIDDVTDDDVSTGRGRVMRGIIKMPSHMDVADEGDLVQGTPAMNPGGTITLMLLDLMAVLDVSLIKDDPVLDGKNLGEALTIVVSGSGAREEEREGLQPDAGRSLSIAGPGEKPANRPSHNVSRGQYSRDLVESFGLPDEEFVVVDGVFTLRTRSKDLLEIDGEVVNFRSDADYEGRYRIEEVVELPDDDSQVFNAFEVEGDTDPVTKKKINATWTVYESIYDPTDPAYVGEIKWFKTVSDDALKSLDDINLRLRRLAYEHCRSKKFIKIPTKFIKELRPYQRTLVNGREVEIFRIPQSSMADDSWQFLARRFVNPSR